MKLPKVKFCFVIIGCFSFLSFSFYCVPRLSFRPKERPSPFLNHAVVYKFPKDSRPQLSAVTCIIESDFRFVDSFLDNVREQFHCPHTEILLAVYTSFSVQK